MRIIRAAMLVLVVTIANLATVRAAEPVFTSTLGIGFVEIPQTPILMAQWETRVKDFSIFVEETGFEWAGNHHFEQSGDHPVVGVSRSDARVFCQWLTEKERTAGRLSPGQKYRLPTDYEWSSAAGLRNAAAGSSAIERKLEAERHFVWGSSWPPPTGAGNFNADFIDGYEDSFQFTSPVGSFEPSEDGVYDLAGNVWEWVTDPSGNPDSEAGLRGGAFVYFRRGSLLAAHRYRVDESARESTFGFRLVLEDKDRNESFLREQSEARASGSEALQGDLLPPEMSEVSNEGASNPGKSPLPGVIPQRGKPHSNSIGMKFVPIAGMETMLVGQTEVRVRDFSAFVEASGVGWGTKPKYSQTPDHAVASVAFELAESFCKWLTKVELEGGLIEESQFYRLPSDQEWSAMAGLANEGGSSPAAREASADGDPVFPWGLQWPPPPDSGNFESASIPGYSENTPYTSVVGRFQPDANGLFDLSGNVSEWVSDRWLPGGDEFVARGGSWIEYERNALLAAKRKRIKGGSARGNVGFRCVLVLEGK